MAGSDTRRVHLPDEVGIVGVTAFVWLVFALTTDRFGTFDNAKIIMLNGAVIALLAIGQTFVLLTGGIDLSVGANVAMTGVLAAKVADSGVDWRLAVAAGVLAGGLLGLTNGLIVHFTPIPPFIVTFSTMGVASSIPLIITGASSVPVTEAGFLNIGRGDVLGIPNPVIIVLVATMLATLLLKATRLGVRIYAVGGNPAAARLAGINNGFVLCFCYTASGLLAGLAGVIATSRLGVGFPGSGMGNELFFAIAGAVVGGVSLYGGVGSAVGALMGAVLIAIISNGLNVRNVDSFWQPFIIGVIILLGVGADSIRSSRAQRRGSVRRTKGDAPPSDPTRGHGPIATEQIVDGEIEVTTTEQTDRNQRLTANPGHNTRGEPS